MSGDPKWISLDRTSAPATPGAELQVLNFEGGLR